jgi:hypothetical protein
MSLIELSYMLKYLHVTPHILTNMVEGNSEYSNRILNTGHTYGSIMDTMIVVTIE